MDAVTALNKLASALYAKDGDVKAITLRRGPRAGSWVATVTREERVYLPDPNEDRTNY